MLSCMSLSSRSSSLVAWSCSLVCPMVQFSLARESECLVPFAVEDGTLCKDFGKLALNPLAPDNCFCTFDTAQYILVVLCPEAITVEEFFLSATLPPSGSSSALLSVFLMSWFWLLSCFAAARSLP